MKKILLLSALLGLTISLSAQIHRNPNIPIRSIATMTVPKIMFTDTTTEVTIRIVNQNQLAPFSLPSLDIVARRTSEPDTLRLIRAEGAPIYPKKYNFKFKNDVLEFKLVFPPTPEPIKYFDIIEAKGDQFYLQGIILMEDMNKEIARGFKAFQAGDKAQALDAFKNVAEMDPYFEFGMGHFNVIYLLADMGRWKEAGEWYKKFQERFFYDKNLHQANLEKMGIVPRLEAGR